MMRVIGLEYGKVHHGHAGAAVGVALRSRPQLYGRGSASLAQDQAAYQEAIGSYRGPAACVRCGCPGP